MLWKLLDTPDDHTLTLVRAGLGVVMLAHGAQKMLGWFGGAGFSATVADFTNHLGIPAAFAVLPILAEFLGGLGLIFGFLTRIAAFAIAVDMLVALFLVHIGNGFFMNWTGLKHGEGFEYHILAICAAVTVMVRGAGTWSCDRLLERAVGQPAPVHFHPQPTGSD